MNDMTKRETKYYTAILILKGLRVKGLITHKEHTALNRKTAKRYGIIYAK